MLLRLYFFLNVMFDIESSIIIDARASRFFTRIYVYIQVTNSDEKSSHFYAKRWEKERDTWQVSRTVSVTFIRQLSVSSTAVWKRKKKELRTSSRSRDPIWKTHENIQPEG